MRYPRKPHAILPSLLITLVLIAAPALHGDGSVGSAVAASAAAVSGGTVSGGDVTTPPAAFVEITIPVVTGFNPANRPPVATYNWQTLGGSADPAEVRRIMISTAGFGSSYSATEDYIRNNPAAPEWSAWEPYSPPGTGTSWTSPPLDFGTYVFAVQGRDAGGTVGATFELDRNMRRVVVSLRTTGPLLTVTSDVLAAPIITATTSTPPVIVDVPSNTPISFCFTADASAYGGVVTGYRWGWDILDLNDDEAWAIPFTPFSQIEECSPTYLFFFGVHVFSVEVIDNDGFKSRAQVIVNTLPVTPTTPISWGELKARFQMP
jgi:hypothetical protein